MNLSNLSTYSDLQAAFIHLVARLGDLRDSLPYQPSDARQVALGGMQRILAGYGMGMNSMYFGRTIDQVTQSMGVTNLSRDEMLKTVDDAWRWGVCTLFHFRLDSLITNVLVAANRSVSPQFRQKAQSILALSAVADQAILLDHLLTLTCIRNSLHNNGIHRTADVDVTIGAMRFAFVRGQPVQCASWQHALVSIDAVVSVIDIVLKAARMVALPQPILDDFAEAVAAGTAQA